MLRQEIKFRGGQPWGGKQGNCASFRVSHRPDANSQSVHLHSGYVHGKKEKWKDSISLPMIGGNGKGNNQKNS